MIYLCGIVIIVRSPGRFNRHMFILAMSKDPIGQNATRKNKLYLGCVWVERFVV
jgi:hypothetical protein